ncbi:hypothetical protein [Caulobacter sp. RHG1]|uniref:hypothetical protein n=1 Tax=Caulobacter sp. (strain RHG1) TaxID=2545762 RepID=UPI0015518881|nr:hypothetical protein [Caulobacter sp. RHG1]
MRIGAITHEVGYTLVVTLRRRGCSAEGVIEASAKTITAALVQPTCRLALSDGTVVRVSLRRRGADGPLLAKSVGPIPFLRPFAW